MRALFRSVLRFSVLLLTVGLNAGLWADGVTPRNFVVLFEIKNYSGGVDDAVDYLFNDLVGAGDQLIVFSPDRVYGYSHSTLAGARGPLADRLKGKLRGDTIRAARGYDQIVREMKPVVAAIEGNVLGNSEASASGESELKSNLTTYRHFLDNLMQIRRINGSLLNQLFGLFRNQPGSNHLIVVYEKEWRPVPDNLTMNLLRDIPKISFLALELFAQQNPRPPFDVAALAEQCSRIPLTLHLLYIAPKNEEAYSRDNLDNSSDMYGAFSALARASGGAVATTNEIGAGLHAVAGVLRGTVDTTYTTHPE